MGKAAGCRPGAEAGAAMSGIVFRRMVQADADSVARVEAACMPVPWSRQSFWEEAAHTDAHYLLAVDTEKDDLIVAYAGCWVLANELYKRLDGNKDYGLKIEHRDIGKDALRGK